MRTALLALFVCACSGAAAEDVGTIESASGPVCLAPNDAYRMGLEESPGGTCGPITGLYFTTDADRVIQPGGNSGLSCAVVKQDGCAPTSPLCAGGDDMHVDAFDVTMSDTGHGAGTMHITGRDGCTSTYTVVVTDD